MPKTLNNLKDQTPTEIAKRNGLFFSVWCKVKYHLDVYRATNRVYFEFAHGINKILWIALYNGARLTFVWLLVSYKHIFVTRPFVITLYVGKHPSFSLFTHMHFLFIF
jgi:hypothetical protein